MFYQCNSAFKLFRLTGYHFNTLPPPPMICGGTPQERTIWIPPSPWFAEVFCRRGQFESHLSMIFGGTPQERTISISPLHDLRGTPHERTIYIFLSMICEGPPCTNEILISDVNSDKNSLTIIYICLKMHCLKYVVNLILFHFILFYFYSCGPGVAI